VTSSTHSTLSVGYLGPHGTFTEQALLTQPDLAAADLKLLPSIAEVLAANQQGAIDLGFAAIENSIEGTVNVTLDTLAFEADLLIQREVVIGIQMNLLGVPGATLDDIDSVVSFPHAAAQCRGFLRTNLPNATPNASNSTADAARLVAEQGDRSCAAVGTALAGQIYGLETIASDIEDHPENATRFVVTAPAGANDPPTAQTSSSPVPHTVPRISFGDEVTVVQELPS
jgi:prephenate dehydratase